MESAGRWAKRTPTKGAIAANASTTASAADVSSATEPVAIQPQSFATISTTAAPSTMALAKRRRLASEATWLFILRPARVTILVLDAVGAVRNRDAVALDLPVQRIAADPKMRRNHRHVPMILFDYLHQRLTLS